MELIYLLFKWVLGFNVFILFVFIYELGKMIKNYIKQKKYGGKKVEVFRHNSTTKIFTLILFVSGIMFNVWALKWGSLRDSVLFQLYLLIIIIQAWSNIVVFEKGVYYMGKFVQWEEIKSINIGESSIQIEIKGSLFGMPIMNKVSRASELMRLIEGNR